MPLSNVFIPSGGYWSSPFSRWQGSFASMHSMKLGAETARAFMASREISPEVFDGIVMGITVHQEHSFYGAPWLAGMIGAPGISGPSISQACATSARIAVTAALEVEVGQRECVIVAAVDRTSNGPHVYYPNPTGPGGKGKAHDPVWDNFGHDPWARNAMIETAEKVAATAGITTEEQHEVALMRYEQYLDALADDRAFQRRYMVPVELKKRRRVVGLVEGDEGITPSTAEGLAKLRPVVEGGTVTFGAQTHPADGNAGMILCTQERAAELARDSGVMVQLLGYGEARVAKGMMPTAVVPAARIAMAHAGIQVADCDAIKTHNPFAVNDTFTARELGLAHTDMNNFGSPLVWGHPQAPTGLRATIELIEELILRGGGIGLFSGCAAGDTAMALVVKVG